jgi:predicted RNase H-like HicB family nuclease
MHPTVWGDMSHNFNIELEREDDGRWIAEIPSLPGVMAYGNSEADAIRAVHALAFRVLADQIIQSKDPVPENDLTVCFACIR